MKAPFIILTSQITSKALKILYIGSFYEIEDTKNCKKKIRFSMILDLLLLFQNVLFKDCKII